MDDEMKPFVENIGILIDKMAATCFERSMWLLSVL